MIDKIIPNVKARTGSAGNEKAKALEVQTIKGYNQLGGKNLSGDQVINRYYHNQKYSSSRYIRQNKTA